MVSGEEAEPNSNNMIHEGMKEPFIEVKDTENGERIEKSRKGQHPWMLYLSTFMAVCGSYEYGAMIGYSSPTQEAITEDLSLTSSEYSLFGSLLCVGAMTGALTSGPIADFVGRIWAMRVDTCFCVAGWLSIYFAEGSLALYMGRLAGGYGIGAFSYVVPVYIAEIAPVNLRGVLTAQHHLSIVTAISLTFILGILLNWRILALTGLIPCFFLIFGLHFIPESPRWLAKRGDQMKFKDSLQALRGENASISQEATEIQDYIEELERLPRTKLLDLLQKRYLRLAIIAVGLMVFEQLGGIKGVGLYNSKIFKSAGVSPELGTTICALVQVVISILVAANMDKVGRKPLILVSAIGLTIACMMTSIAFFFKAHEILVKAEPILALTSLLIYHTSYSIGMGIVPYVIMSEIFPINVKGTAGSIATTSNWFCSWLVAYTFSFLMSWSSYGTFLIYGSMNALAVAFVIKMVPETKGRSLEQIQAFMDVD